MCSANVQGFWECWRQVFHILTKLWQICFDFAENFRFFLEFVFQIQNWTISMFHQAWRMAPPVELWSSHAGSSVAGARAAMVQGRASDPYAMVFADLGGELRWRYLPVLHPTWRVNEFWMTFFRKCSELTSQNSQNVEIELYFCKIWQISVSHGPQRNSGKFN